MRLPSEGVAEELMEITVGWKLVVPDFSSLLQVAALCHAVKDCKSASSVSFGSAVLAEGPGQ